MAFEDFWDTLRRRGEEARRQFLREGGLEGEVHYVVPDRVWEPRYGGYVLVFACPHCDTRTETVTTANAVACVNCGDALLWVAGAA